MKNSYQEARKLFLKMPEEIFKLWFDGRIEANGWPPVGDYWHGALRMKSEKYWQELEWEKCFVKIDQDMLTKASRKIITDLYDANFNGKDNNFGEQSGLDSKNRMHSIVKYIKENLKLPDHLIFIYENDKYEIVDGCHRLVLFFLLQNLPGLSSSQEVWVGKIK